MLCSEGALNEGLGQPDQALALMVDRLKPKQLASRELSQRLVEIIRKAISSDTAKKVKRSHDLLSKIKEIHPSVRWIEMPIQELENS